MCTARLFSHGDDFFALKFYLSGHPPSTILGVRKLETPDGDDHIPLRSLVATQYWIFDRQTDGFDVAYTALALRSAVNTVQDIGSLCDGR